VSAIRSKTRYSRQSFSCAIAGCPSLDRSFCCLDLCLSCCSLAVYVAENMLSMLNMAVHMLMRAPNSSALSARTTLIILDRFFTLELAVEFGEAERLCCSRTVVSQILLINALPLPCGFCFLTGFVLLLRCRLVEHRRTRLLSGFVFLQGVLVQLVIFTQLIGVHRPAVIFVAYACTSSRGTSEFEVVGVLAAEEADRGYVLLGKKPAGGTRHARLCYLQRQCLYQFSGAVRV
jgi:hypothetical protein